MIDTSPEKHDWHVADWATHSMSWDSDELIRKVIALAMHDAMAASISRLWDTELDNFTPIGILGALNATP